MRVELVEPVTACPVRRLTAEGGRWRVRVEAWEAGDGWRGRLVFEPDGPGPGGEPRASPPVLGGSSREEVIAAAHELPDGWLSRLLHSLA